MKAIRLFACLAVAALFPVVPSAFAAFDAFLKIQGVEGESSDAQHPGWIEIQSFSWGVSQLGSSSSGGGGGAGRATFKDLTITKRLDKASPLLFLRCAEGRHIPEVVLVLRAPGGERHRFFQVKLENVTITSVSVEGTADGEMPSESLSFNYTKIEWSYYPQSPTGGAAEPVTEGWDLASNTKV